MMSYYAAGVAFKAKRSQRAKSKMKFDQLAVCGPPAFTPAIAAARPQISRDLEVYAFASSSVAVVEC